MVSPSVRTVLPLSIVTATSMLAMDLYLPAVPTLQAALAVSVSVAQATVAVFLAGLAASQLLWGELMTRFGPRRCVVLASVLLTLTGLGCALSPGIGVLLALRALQGAAAGAATVVAPSVVRATLQGDDAVRGLASIAMVESIVPAAGPLLGALLLQVADWRATFFILAGVTALSAPFAARVTPRELPGMDHREGAGYGRILGNLHYLRLSLSHALCVGALLTFVASAPQLMVRALQRGAEGFVLLQLVGVACFMLGASQAGRLSARLGAAGCVRLGALGHVLLCGALTLACAAGAASFGLLLGFWALFCLLLAVRGPAAFSEALALPAAQLGRASAMLMLALLAAGALGTQAVAPFLDGSSAVPLPLGMCVMCGASLALVVPYPARGLVTRA